MKNIILLILISLTFGQTNGFISMNDASINKIPDDKLIENLMVEYKINDSMINPDNRVIIVDYMGNVIRESKIRRNQVPGESELIRNILRRCDLIMEDSHSLYYLLIKKIELQNPESQRDIIYFKKNTI